MLKGSKLILQPQLLIEENKCPFYSQGRKCTTLPQTLTAPQAADEMGKQDLSKGIGLPSEFFLESTRRAWDCPSTSPQMGEKLSSEGNELGGLFG